MLLNLVIGRSWHHIEPALIDGLKQLGPVLRKLWEKDLRVDWQLVFDINGTYVETVVCSSKPREKLSDVEIKKLHGYIFNLFDKNSVDPAAIKRLIFKLGDAGKVVPDRIEGKDGRLHILEKM